MTTGEKIQSLRKAKAMTQEELASQITVSRQAVSRWELNEVLPDSENLLQLSKIFSVSVDYLLDNSVEIESELPLVQSVKRQIEKKSRIKSIILTVYLLAVLVFFLITRSVMVSFAYLFLGALGYVLYLVIRFLRNPERRK